MEHFKDQLKIELRIYAILCGVLAVFAVMGFAAEAGLVALTPVGDADWQSTWRGMLSGVSVGMLGVMLFGLIRRVQALKDEKKLKKLYVEFHDERQIQIWTAARATSMQFSLLLGLVAGLILSYFHMTIGVTIIALETIHALIGGACKLYYSLKY